MKKIFCLVLMSLLSVSGIKAAKTITLDGIKYTLKEDLGLKCKANDKKQLVDIVIPASVRIDGFDYFVNEIESQGFSGCKSLRSVVLPNSIKTIGEFAFQNCENLESIVMPDEAEVIIPEGNYGYGKVGIFKGCKSLSQVRGNELMYPHYVLYQAMLKCEDVPFYKTIQETGASAMVAMKMNKDFRDFAVERIKEPVEQWQRRKDYETLAQWEQRVTDSNRKSMIDEAIMEAREEYIKTFAPAKVTASLGKYDAEYGFFPVETVSYGNIYVAVPPDKSEDFNKNWDNVELRPVFGIVDHNLGILDCSYILNGEIFNSYNRIVEDDLSELTLNITPLASLREFEQMLASGEQKEENIRYYDPDVIDIDIPSTEASSENTFAIIIGNENYQRVAPVEYAMNDARIFAKYCARTLGIPEKNIRTYYNATYGDIVAAMEDIANIASAYKGDLNVIFYYAGHGLPDESSRNAYLLPIDATGTQIEACYPMSKLYAQLSDLKANSVIAFIDACFSGSLRGDGMLASARGIKLKPREIDAQGNLVVLSAASADQSAFPFREKNHGLFSYYVLKKLHDTSGDVNLGELSQYVIDEVSKQSSVENGKPQVPNVRMSSDLSATWRDIKLK